MENKINHNNYFNTIILKSKNDIINFINKTFNDIVENISYDCLNISGN